MVNFDENLIKIQSITTKGELPNPFIMNDGSSVKTEADWHLRRQEMYKTAVELQYGTMPPQPEFLEVELLDDAAQIHNYRITTGRKDSPVSFIMRVILPPEGSGKFPAIVDGDLCWRYAFDKEYLQTVIGNGIAFVLFNRVELVPDRNVDRSKGQVVLAAAFRKSLLETTKKGAAAACRRIAKRIQGLPIPVSIGNK